MLRKSLIVSLAIGAIILNSSYSIVSAADLPEVKILATGGTIAGSAPSNTQMTGYKAGALGVETLINAVPELKI